MMFPSISPSFLSARKDAHYAAQLVAAIGHTLLPADPDFHYSSTTFSDGGLDGAKLPDGRQARLDLATLTLTLKDSALPLRGCSMTNAIEWVQQAIGCALTFPEWEMPDGPSAEYGVFEASVDDLAHLTRWFATAQRAFVSLEPSIGTAKDIRVWPHHFDIARLFVLRESETSEEMTSIGVGMTPGDAGIAEPYFYVTPWPYPASRPTRPLASGRFNVEGWYGTVLDASHVEDQDQINGFLSESYGIFVELLNTKDAE